MAIMSFKEAEKVIENGDIVFLRTPGGPIHALIDWVTSSVYPHVCMAFWITVNSEKFLMVVESKAIYGKRIAWINEYSNIDMDIIKAPKQWLTIATQAFKDMGQLRYGYMEAIYAGLRDLFAQRFNIHIPYRHFAGSICSETVAKILNLSNTNITPQDLFEQLYKGPESFRVQIRQKTSTPAIQRMFRKMF